MKSKTEKENNIVDPTFHLKVNGNETQTKKYKKYREKWNENPKNFIVGDFPIHIDIELNTNCNLKCFMCFQSFDKPKVQKMDTSLVKKIINEGAKKGLCSIKFQYRGEPLLDDRIVDFVKYAKDKGIIEVMFNTNATLLTEEKARGLIEAGLDKLICSVDGYTKEVYENVRIGGNFETVLENIRRLQRIKKEMGKNNPIVRVQMVDTPRNHQEIAGYINFWRKIADHVGIEDMLDYEAKENDDTPLPDWSCAQLWQRMFVLADGDVLPCCRAIKGGNEKIMVLGNAKTQTIEDIWKGRKIKQLRLLHMNGESHKSKMCSLCGLRKDVLKSGD